jgi:hypothetical protein
LQRSADSLAYNLKNAGIHPQQGTSMRIHSLGIGSGAAIAVLTIFGASVMATADDKPAGEMWHQTMSMEMPGMTMPPRTLDVCLPSGKAQESLSKPQGPGVGDNCSVQDAKHEGNRYTAKFICTGKQPVQGTIENIFEGDHSKLTMVLSLNGQQMTMKTDAQKVGTPCTPRSMPGTK